MTQAGICQLITMQARYTTNDEQLEILGQEHAVRLTALNHFAGNGRVPANLPPNLPQVMDGIVSAESDELADASSDASVVE